MHTTKSLTRSFNITADTLRYYEKLGLLNKAVRKENGYRLYDEHTPRRLRFIQQCQAVGFTLKEVHQLLQLDDDPSKACEDVTAFIEAKRRYVHQHVRYLHDIEGILAKLVSLCSVDDERSTDHCPIINTFYSGDLPEPDELPERSLKFRR
jgi:DNA-binding transcriptional MerR regulator